jgi:small subunit ribosomal protein S17
MVKAAPPSVTSITGKTPAVDASKKHGFRRKLIGTVRSNKMQKTVVVEVVRSHRDEKYKKYLTTRERYQAHDEKNEYIPGDRVEIQEHRPLSKNKRWIVTKLITRTQDQFGEELKDEVLGLK